jgi:hypothetical protein
MNEGATVKKAFEELWSNYRPSGSGQYDRLCSRFNDIAVSVEDFPTSCTDPRHAQLNKQKQ